MVGCESKRAEHSRLHDSLKPSRHDLAHCVQPASAFMAVADCVRRRDVAYFRRSARDGVGKKQDGGLDCCHCMPRDVCELRARAQVVQSKSSFGSHAAVCRNLLHVRNRSLSGELLARKRWWVERKSAGSAIVFVETSTSADYFFDICGIKKEFYCLITSSTRSERRASSLSQLSSSGPQEQQNW